MKNKNGLIVIISILVLVAVMGLFWILKEKNILFTQEKVFNFDKYTLLQDEMALITDQSSADEEFMAKVANGNYTHQNPLVVSNPYQISPLTALVGFKTNEKVSVKVTIKAKEGGKDLVYTTLAATNHYIPIYGLYMNYVNKVILEVAGNQHTLEIPVESSEKITTYMIVPTKVNVNNLSAEDNDFYFLSTPLGMTTIAYDQQGEIRWFLNYNLYKEITRLDNGHFLLSAPGSDFGLVEVDLLGKIYNSYNLEYTYAFNHVILPNGNLLYSTTIDDNNIVVEASIKDGKTIKTYDPFKILNEIDSAHMATVKEKWGNVRTLSFDEKNNAIIIGNQFYSTIMSINYKTGKLNWIFADPAYYSNKFSSYLLKPSGEFKYPVGNTNATMNGDVLSVFVTDWDGTKDYSCTRATNDHSYAADYKIDTAKKSVSEVWQYGRDLAYYSYDWADYKQTNNEKTILFGREFFKFDRGMDECNLFFEGNFNSKILTLDQNNQVAFNMTIDNAHNKIRKMSIIDDKYSFSKTSVNIHTHNLTNDTYKTEDFTEKYNTAHSYPLPLNLYRNTIHVVMNPEDAGEYNMILVDEYGKAYTYTTKELSINVKTGIGKVNILFEKEGVLYNTGYYIDL